MAKHRWLETKEATSFHGVARSTLYRWLRQGLIKALKTGTGRGNQTLWSSNKVEK